MRTAHEISDWWMNEFDGGFIDFINFVKNESYNEAIEDAASNVNKVALDHTSIAFIIGSILKLKK